MARYLRWQAIGGEMRNNIYFYHSTLACAVFAAALPCPPANAEESVTPLLAGVTIGIPAGAAPPPGLYSSETFLYLRGPAFNGAGQKTNLTLTEFEVSQSFLLSTSYKILGGQYYAFAIQPLKSIDSGTPGSFNSRVGAFNTILSPLNLSWDLGKGFYASYGQNYYIPDGTYSFSGPRVALGFFSFEQAFALTYLKDGYNVTANTNLDINASNPTTNYRSGDVFGIDFTATKAFGNFNIGIGGYYVDQFQDDKLNGLTVGQSPYNGVGNRWHEAALGPYLSYNFGKVTVQAWYTQDVYAVNTIKIGTGWLRLSVPLGDPLATSTPVPRPALPNHT